MSLTLVLTTALLVNLPAEAQSGRALAEGAKLHRQLLGDLILEIPADAPVGVRTRYLESPNRIVIEFDDFDLTALTDGFGQEVRGIETVQFGQMPNGARIVMVLKEPFALKSFEFDDEALNGKTGLKMIFEKISDDEFHEFALKVSGVDTQAIEIEETKNTQGKPLIVIDPGHGGVDPGAKRHGVYEKEITLQAANIVADVLRQTGDYQIVMTREDDVFVSLLARRQFAERLGADLFLSIHADALEEGDARGTTIYEVSNEASSQIAEHFARYENRVDLFAGEVIYTQETDMGLVLSDMAHELSKEKSGHLARLLQMQWQNINTRAEESRRESADFAVLKSPDVPSLLLEIGYMSNDEDFTRIQNQQWLTDMALGLTEALEDYFSTP